LTAYNYACQDCGQGSYCEGGHHHVDCPAGTASLDKNAIMSSQCRPCGPRSYAPNPGSSSCTSCDPPKETGNPRSEKCVSGGVEYECGFKSCGKRTVCDKHGCVNLGFLISMQ
jgi:ribosomal protein L37E